MSSIATKILLIEDEEAVRAGIEEHFSREGYQVLSGGNGVVGLELFKSENPDLVILDLVMPGIDGLEVCRQIRSSGLNTPIIMLTAKCGEIDKVVGLELGADDYLTKPFSYAELFARVKALLRRFQSVGKTAPNGKQERDELCFGDVKIDFRTYRAHRGGVRDRAFRKGV